MGAAQPACVASILTVPSHPSHCGATAGAPEDLVNYFHFVAEEVRAGLAQLGFRSLNELIGRADVLRQRPAPLAKTSGLDLVSPLSGAGRRWGWCRAGIVLARTAAAGPGGSRGSRGPQPRPPPPTSTPTSLLTPRPLSALARPQGFLTTYAGETGASKDRLAQEVHSNGPQLDDRILADADVQVGWWVLGRRLLGCWVLGAAACGCCRRGNSWAAASWVTPACTWVLQLPGS